MVTRMGKTYHCFNLNLLNRSGIGVSSGWGKLSDFFSAPQEKILREAKMCMLHEVQAHLNSGGELRERSGAQCGGRATPKTFTGRVGERETL